MSPDLNNIVEVNIHRFKEGARVLEDIARFLLKDEALFEKIKALKHSILGAGVSIHDDDVGGPGFEEDNQRADMFAIVHANANRMQEAARVLEELLDSAPYKKARFLTYDIHHELTARLQHFYHRDALQGVYPICDPDRYAIEDMVRVINDSDVTICQLRMKQASAREVYDAAKQFKVGLREGVLLIINDHVDVAFMVADGVHVGQDDLPVDVIRQHTSQSFIIGVSCHSVTEAQAAISAGASYIGVGQLFPSATKLDATPTSLAELKKITHAVSSLPIAAIGGITEHRIEDTLEPLGIAMFAMQQGFWKQRLG